ncbi:hypothetical protein ACFL35_00260 [Candidatus Riflebacteria bacterium]
MGLFRKVLVMLLFPIGFLSAGTWDIGYPNPKEAVIYKTVSAMEFKQYPAYSDSETLLIEWKGQAFAINYLKNPDGTYDMFTFTPRNKAGKYHKTLLDFDKQRGKEKVLAGMPEKPATKRRKLDNWGLSKKPYFFVFLASSLIAQFAYEQAVTAHNTADNQAEIDRAFRKAQVLYDTRNVLTGVTAASVMMRF